MGSPDAFDFLDLFEIYRTSRPCQAAFYCEYAAIVRWLSNGANARQVLDLSRPGGGRGRDRGHRGGRGADEHLRPRRPDDYDTFDLGAEWLKARREPCPRTCSSGRRADARREKVAAHLLGLVYETPTPRTFAAFLEQLEATDPVELKLHLFGRYGSCQPSRRAGRDRARRPRRRGGEEEFLASLAEYSDKYESYAALLELGRRRAEGAAARPAPALVRARLPAELRGLARGRGARRRGQAGARGAALARAARRARDARLPVLAGARHPDPRFFPSWWMRPWVILWEHKGTKIFCYPIAPAPEEGASPAEVARVYKALGDEGRLRLLRRLSDGPLTLGRRRPSSASRSRPRTTTSRSCATPASSRSATRTRTSTASAATCRRRASC